MLVHAVLGMNQHPYLYPFCVEVATGNPESVWRYAFRLFRQAFPNINLQGGCTSLVTLTRFSVRLIPNTHLPGAWGF